MSIDQRQRMVNSLDKEIAEWEKKKASADKKAAEYRKKASNIKIGKNTPENTKKSKLKQIEGYEAKARKAEEERANCSKKIAEKRQKRNDAYQKLQAEQKSEQKKQEKSIKNMKDLYEKRIAELESARFPKFAHESFETSSDNKPDYDVFVSHAWEDKESFVNDFVKALQSLGVKVWYDTSEIKWGDSMRERIDNGLRKSKFGVVVLSPNYIAENKYWTKAELDGLFQLESVNGKVLLPIWHNLTKQEVLNYSPIIANKMAMNTASMTAQEIAEELLKLIPKDEGEENNNG